MPAAGHWGCPAVWEAFLSFCQHMKFWDGSIGSTLVQAQAAVPARAGQLLAVRPQKLPAWKTQGFRQVVWCGRGLALGVCRVLQMGICTWDAPACSRGQLPEVRLAEQTHPVLAGATGFAATARPGLARSSCRLLDEPNCRSVRASARVLPAPALRRCLGWSQSFCCSGSG